MSRSRRKLFSLGLGADEMTLVDLATQRPLTSLPLAAYVPGAASVAHADWEPSIAALVAQANLADGADMQVTVSDAWSRYWMFVLPAGVTSLVELQALAAVRFETLFGTSTEGWKMMADWRSTGQVLVCALPEGLLEALQTQAVQKGWRLRSIQPSVVRLLSAYQRQIPDHAWVACYGQRNVILALVENGEVCHVRRHPFSEPPDETGLACLLDAEMLRLGLDAAPALCVLGLTPEFDPATLIAGMRLVLPQLSKGCTIMSESLALGLQGVSA